MGLALSYQCKLPWVARWMDQKRSAFLPSPSFQVSSPSSCHTYTPRAPISLSHSSHHILMGVLNNPEMRQSEGTPKSLPSLHVKTVSPGNQYCPQRPVDEPSCEPKIRGRRDISRIWAPHCPPRAPSLVLYNKIVHEWQMLWKEEDSQFRWPVCVSEEAAGRWNTEESCVPHGFKRTSRTVVAAWWVRACALEPVFTDFSSQLCLWLTVPPWASYLTSLCLISSSVK